MKSRGYILVEAIVSMGLLSLGMIAINGAVRQAIITRAQAQDYTIARILLEQVAAEQEIELEVVEGSGAGVFPEPNARFSYEWKITAVTLPTPELPQNLPPEISTEFNQSLQRANRIGKLAVKIKWSRMGLDFEAEGQTLLRPGQLWVPLESLPQ